VQLLGGSAHGNHKEPVLHRRCPARRQAHAREVMPPLLEARELSASYGRVAALKPISLTVAEGELVTVLGPNGAGKTTLLRALTRLISAQGKLLFKGEDV